jgi:fructose-specific component phosphotransferase system IIB-like protein
MKLTMMVAAAAVTMALGACQTIPKEQTLAQYCGDVKHADKDVCKVNVEIDGQKTALASTNMSLSQARAIADRALAQANTAQQTALQAQQSAVDAQKAAVFNCETKTIRRTSTGSCSPGYKLVSCTQTHYTKRAGGPSIMRSIDDGQCTFQTKVLEVQARCCADGAVQPTEVKDTAPAAPTPAAPATSK